MPDTVLYYNIDNNQFKFKNILTVITSTRKSLCIFFDKI